MRKFRRTIAAVSAAAMLAGCIAVPGSTDTTVNAGEILGETSFDYKMIPWHTVESSPAKQNFEIADGAAHITILKATGADHEKWDLQFRHKNLNFKAKHEYTVSFKAKGSREGIELSSKIDNLKGDEEYCVLFGDEKTIGNGPFMGGKWGNALDLTTDYQTITGTFKPTKDLENCEWSFLYANGDIYEGNAKDGDEIWFDEMSIVCKTCEECNADSNEHYGMISRDFSGLENNYISVNQLGYLPKTKKVAVLGDNSGDVNYKASSITVKGGEKFSVVNSDGKTVFEGKGSAASYDKDSGDTVVKLDFSELTEPGTYHIECGKYRSSDFRIAGDVYSNESTKLLTNAVNYFYQNRSGSDIEAKYITSGDNSMLSHRGRNMSDTSHVQKEWKKEYSSEEEASSKYSSSRITANQGWYESGNEAKSVVSGGMASWILQNMYERDIMTGNKTGKFEDSSGTVAVPETGNKIPDILDECMYELDFMSQMKVVADEPTWGSIAEGMIYSSVQNSSWVAESSLAYIYDDDGYYYNHVRITEPPTFAATLTYAANAAQLARLIEPYDSEKAKYYLSEAKSAYDAYLKNYYPADTSEMTNPDTGITCAAEVLNEKSLYAPSGKSGDDTDLCGDLDVSDDAYWAACEIFVSASRLNDESAAKYLKELESYNNAYTVPTRITGGDNTVGSLTSFNHGNTAAAGTLTLALNTDLLSEKNTAKIKSSVLEAADNYIRIEEEQGYGIPYRNDGVKADNSSSGLAPEIEEGYAENSNSMVLNNAVIMAYAYDLTGYSEYMSGVTGAMDYLLGTNPMSFSYITGYGSYSVKNPHHRYWQGSIDSTLPYAPDGVLASGPNAGLEDPYVRALGFAAGKYSNPSQRCYVDSVESWSTNDTTLSGNAALAWVASFLDDQSAGTVKPTPSPTPSDTPVTTEPAVSAVPSEKPVTTLPETTAAEPGCDTTPGVPDNSGAAADIKAVKGDIDGSGIVDISDLSTLAIALVDKIELSAQAAENADVTRDGEVNLSDLACLRQFLSKIIEKF